MKRKSKSNNNLISKEDLGYEEEIDENGICEIPVTGNMVAQFSFTDNNLHTDEPLLKQQEPEVKKIQMNTNPTLESMLNKVMEFNANKAITPYPYGITPPVDGEYLDTRRSFSLRKSTIRMLNELKAADPDLDSASFTIEVESGTDKLGDKTYSKKNFSGIRINAFPQDVFEVADAIKGVLKAGTRDCYLTEASKLVNA